MVNSSAAPHEEERQAYTLPSGEQRWLTWEEAQAEGFCPGCGAFVAGIDSEIPSMSRIGLCSECVADIEDESGSGADFDDF